MNCLELKKYLLYEYVDGNILSPTESDKIRLHLEACSECRREEEIVRSILSELSPSSDLVESGKDLWPNISASITQSDPFLSLLAESLARRDLSTATDLVTRNIHRVAELDPNEKNAPALLDYFGQWMHITGSAHVGIAGYSNLVLLKSTYRKFPENRRGRELIDCVHLSMVAGFIALHTEQYDAAVRHFHFVLAAEGNLSGKDGVSEDVDLIAVANHAIGHAYRRKAEYAIALSYTDKAIDMATRQRRIEMAAAFSVSKGWFLFQCNRPADAEDLFLKAEQVLEDCGDHLSLGNINAARARIRERQGLCEDALDFQAVAIRYYEKCDPRHGNMARSLVRIAFLKRLIALRSSSNSQDRGQRTAVIEALHNEALKHLDKADEIYCSREDYRGRGSTRLGRAFIRMDQHDYGEAEKLATEAYEFAKENRDHVLMARSLVLLCKVEHLKHDLRSPNVTLGCPYVGPAWRLAQDAVDLAERTQDNRLIAHSHIWLGMTLLKIFPPDIDGARKCYEKAKALIPPPIQEDFLLHSARSLPGDVLADVGLNATAALRRRRLGARDWIIDELTLLNNKLAAVNRSQSGPENPTAGVLEFLEVKDERSKS